MGPLHFAILFMTLSATTICCQDTCESEDSKCKENKPRAKTRDIDVSEILEELAFSLKSIKKSCGEICETREGHERVKKDFGVWSKELEKEVDCKALFSNKEIDAESKFARPLLKVRYH